MGKNASFDTYIKGSFWIASLIQTFFHVLLKSCEKFSFIKKTVVMVNI